MKCYCNIDLVFEDLGYFRLFSCINRKCGDGFSSIHISNVYKYIYINLGEGCGIFYGKYIEKNNNDIEVNNAIIIKLLQCDSLYEIKKFYNNYILFN